ncbi:MAG: FAD-binding and (Fe-S)-binding domain-containing protein [Planctomycetia bacterium]|nr:FAD-binding and (Fe-S)-binding domain-containing protein [Planctomycetia bacterium]
MIYFVDSFPLNLWKHAMPSFLKKIRTFLPADRIYTDALRRLAWGTDAGFYRLLPQIVIRSDNENEISRLLKIASEEGMPVTFRAAGTSLSGQAISDSVLVVAGKHWEKYSVSGDGTTITLQPGLIGERVNQILKPYGRKLGPDPASIKSAMIGGIVMNNASGMNCGTHANSDQMLRSVRMVLADGTILDTADKVSRDAFAAAKPQFLAEIVALRDAIRADEKIASRLRKKYAIKNVTGLNLRPFLAYDDPFEIMAHLLVGSEGTLAFLSEITMKTVVDLPFKATAMLYFSDIQEAARAVVAMKRGPVESAELLDKKSLASVNDTTGENLTAVLTETKGSTQEELDANIREIHAILEPFQTFTPVRFTDREEEYAPYWQIRSGIFPAVGGTRKPGTTCLIEDVAFPIEQLPEATRDLQDLIAANGYDDGCIYGHALEGNFHFILNQEFHTDAEVARYEKMMNDVARLVVEKYDGSLKAEHGTGRNMAPFVKYEWGDEIFALMQRVKTLFDPKHLLNPGVIFNDDPKCFVQHFKPLPKCSETIDKCIECGFCEVNCVTCGFSLSSRQRIVIQREIARLRAEGETARAKKLERAFRYPGNQTCAGDGLCALSCPMGINVGHLTHELREREFPQGSVGYLLGKIAADFLKWVKIPIRMLLRVAHLGHTILGTSWMSSICRTLHTGSFRCIPLWTPAMPKAYVVPKNLPDKTAGLRTVVYFPSCINQAFGTARHSPDSTPLAEKTVALLHKAGYTVLFPKNADNLCCGTIWESKGMPAIADQKTAELEAALREASDNGTYPILCDQSPCLYRMREKMPSLKLYEPVEFITEFLLDRLEFHPIDRPITIHATCSTKKMKLDGKLVALAQRCSTNVTVPTEVNCCGFAGDKGFTLPEVNAYGLRKLGTQVAQAHVEVGYSNSRTCEIGLSTHTGIPYLSIIYLVDEVTTPITP